MKTLKISMLLVAIASIFTYASNCVINGSQDVYQDGQTLHFQYGIITTSGYYNGVDCGYITIIKNGEKVKLSKKVINHVKNDKRVSTFKKITDYKFYYEIKVY